MSVSDLIVPAETGTIAVEGGKIFYAVSGKGPALVFAHGLGGNLSSWWQQVGAFSERHTCIAFSHRGFAPSTDETGTPRPDFYARDLLALLDRLDIARAVVIGQSMGGWTAMELSLLAPARLSGLVLSATTGSLQAPGIATLAETARSDAAELCLARGVPPAAGLRMAAEQSTLYELFRGIDRQSGDWSRANVRVALDAARIRPPEAFPALDFPIQAIVGAEDIVCPPSNLERLVAVMPGVRLAVVPEAGHSVYFERAVAFNGILADYLQSLKALS